MKLVLYQTAAGAGARPGLLTPRGVVDIVGAVGPLPAGQPTIDAIIDGFDALRPGFERLEARAIRSCCRR